MKQVPLLMLMLGPAAALSACAPDAAVERPALTIPAQFTTTSTSNASADLASWWMRFEDPVLASLIERALSDNSDLRQAAARIRQARARQRITGAARSPSVDAIGQAGYTRISENAVPELPGTGTGQPTLGLPGMDFTTFRAGFDASWEIDLFGGQDRREEAASARGAAAILQMCDIQVALAAEVGSNYLDYRSLQQRIHLAEQRLAGERELGDLIDARVRNGLGSSDSVRRQEQRVAEAASALAAIRAERDVRLHAIALLVGEPPNALSDELAAVARLPATGFDVPAGLPSELLLRRPDLRAAEQEFAAALSEVGAARADLFPKITLTGALQLVSTSLANLLAPGSLQINAAAAVSLPIFDGGRRRATVALRKAEAEELAEAYRGRALAAFRDVEDALSRLESSRTQQIEREASVAAARDAAATLEVRYRNRLIPLSELVEARQAQLNAEDALAQARAATADHLVSLYKSLGGGWNPDGGYDG